MINRNDMIKNVMEKEYRACVNNLSLTVFLYGHERDGVEIQPDIKTLMHIHSYIEIFCCVSEGAAIMTHEGIVKLSYGDVVLIPVNYPHFAFGSNDSLLSLGFSGKRIDSKSAYNLYSDFSVDESKDLMIVTEKGMTIRVRCADIRSVSRNAQGVTLAKLEEGDKIARIAPVVKDEEENGAENN